MKYTYAYKDSGGKRHEESMDAASRDAVFAALRSRGIRPIKVVAADGSKANGEVRGIRRRVAVAIVLIAAVVVGAVAYFVGARSGDSGEAPHRAPGRRDRNLRAGEGRLRGGEEGEVRRRPRRLLGISQRPAPQPRHQAPPA